MSGIVGGRRTTGDLMGRRRTASGARSIIAGIVCVAIVAIVAVLLWSNRKVSITLNGERYSIRVGSTCEQVISDAELFATAGNLVSVSGNKLEDGAGYAFTATLGGNQDEPGRHLELPRERGATPSTSLMAATAPRTTTSR